MGKNKIKILVTIPSLKNAGGVSNYYRVLNLSKQDNIDYFTITSSGKLKFFNFFLKYIDFFIKIQNYQIVHVNPSLGKTAIWRDLILVVLTKIRNKKSIVFTRGWDNKYENKIKKSRVLLKLFSLYNKSDSFIVLGDCFKNKLIDMGIDSNKNFFIETTIANDVFINSFSIEDRLNNLAFNKKIKFLFMSRLVKNKGLYLALEIFLKIKKIHEDLNFEFIVAGDGPLLKESKLYVKEKNIKNVVFKGYVENYDKHDLLVNSDIVLFPTKYSEGLPNCILEGMLYGLPIISRINSAIPEWIINNKNGFITKSIDADDFIPFISKLISNKQLYKKISILNHKIAIENFVPKMVKKRLIKIYNNS